MSEAMFSIAREQERAELIQQIGSNALSEVQLADPVRVHVGMRIVDPNSQLRAERLHPTIVNLAGQTMHCVDLVLQVRDAVDDYIIKTDSKKPSRTDRIAGRYLAVLIDGADDTITENIARTWKLAFDKRDYAGLMKRAKKYSEEKNKAIPSAFIKSKPPTRPSVKPRKANRFEKRARSNSFDASKSTSFKQSAEQKRSSN